MTMAHTNSSIHPQQYHSLSTAVLTQAEQQDRWLTGSELKAFSDFFSSGSKRLAVVEKLGQQSQVIISAAADRIFYNGSAMAYLPSPPNRENLPGYTLPPRQSAARPKERLKLQIPSYGNPLRGLLETLKNQFSSDREPLPSGFRPINIQRYGKARMQRSMRDLDWFLRYIIYAIAAGDCSIITINVRGLRGVIPEDVTEATVLSIQEMRWRALQYFKGDAEAIQLICEPFDVMIAQYRVEKPPMQPRPGVSSEQQGLQLPESYRLTQPRFVMQSLLAETEKQAVIRAAYRQVFERDITQEYGLALTDLESRYRSSEFSTQEFVRQLGHSRLYRDLFYEPFSISRMIELAVRHFLGRGIYSLSEFQTYFERVSEEGLKSFVNMLVDSAEYAEYFGEATVPYLRGLGQEAQQCRNWSAQLNLFKPKASTQKHPEFVTQFSSQQPNQHVYGAGNDCLEIQFGAIFPSQGGVATQPTADHRRILIGCQPDQASGWGKVPGAPSEVIRLSARPQKMEQGGSIDLRHHSAEAVIQAAYRQILGREPFSGQRLTPAEAKLKSGEITLREFVRRLAKSQPFRELYWDSLYITKAIEYIHRRLIGRPTYGRAEMGRYYDICAKQGFYGLIDALVDSAEYLEAFDENTLPYERYITPRGYDLRSRHHPNCSISPVSGVRVADGTWVQEAMQRNRAQTARINGHSIKPDLSNLTESLTPESPTPEPQSEPEHDEQALAVGAASY